MHEVWFLVLPDILWENGADFLKVRKLSHPELQGQAMTVEPFRSIINPDDQLFAAPASMIEAIQKYCRQTNQHVPETPAEICRCSVLLASCK